MNINLKDKYQISLNQEQTGSITYKNKEGRINYELINGEIEKKQLVYVTENKKVDVKNLEIEEKDKKLIKKCLENILETAELLY